VTGRSNCSGCHRRSDGSLEPKLPVHKDCTGCHLLQFTNAASSDNPICTICHTREGLNSSNAPTKSFPRLRSFMAEFDHAQHLRGTETARPSKACAACHSLANRGVAETIPARLNAHQICYDCHSPGKSASATSSCSSCHKLGSYSPTSTATRSYRVGFSHADHGSRQRLTCETCHNVLARGLRQARQVSSIAPALHHSNARARSCMTCHNGQRAFGDAKAEFDNCKRCHKGLTFRS
jgi:c(7)-type cytochrome triheme protein